MFNELHRAKDYFKSFSEKRLKDELNLYSCLNSKTLQESVFEKIIKEELQRRKVN
jgi:hypothetical protein